MSLFLLRENLYQMISQVFGYANVLTCPLHVYTVEVCCKKSFVFRRDHPGYILKVFLRLKNLRGLFMHR